MNLKLPASFKNIEKRLSPKRMIFSWYRHYKAAFFLVFLIVLGFGGWSWFQSLYRYQWTEEEKKTYLDSYFKETTFKEGKFQASVDDLKKRSESHEETLKLERDYFAPRPEKK